VDKNRFKLIIQELELIYHVHDLDKSDLHFLFQHFQHFDPNIFSKSLQHIGIELDSFNGLTDFDKHTINELLKIIEETKIEIKKTKKQFIKDLMRLVTYLAGGLGVIFILLLFSSLITHCNKQYDIEQSDGVVMQKLDYEQGTDTDTSSMGVLKLSTFTKSVGSGKTASYQATKMVISILTKNPQIVRLKITYTEDNLTPFEIKVFETKGEDGSASIITELPLNVAKVEWVK
jgi:hypothetical protein